MAEGSLRDSNLALKLRFGAVASFDFGVDNLGVLTEGLPFSVMISQSSPRSLHPISSDLLV